MTQDVDFLGYRTIASDSARLSLCLRLAGFEVRRAVRDIVLGLAARWVR